MTRLTLEEEWARVIDRALAERGDEAILLLVAAAAAISRVVFPHEIERRAMWARFMDCVEDNIKTVSADPEVAGWIVAGEAI